MSWMTAPDADVTIPTLKGNKGNLFFFSISKYPEALSSFFSISNFSKIGLSVEERILST